MKLQILPTVGLKQEDAERVAKLKSMKLANRGLLATKPISAAIAVLAPTLTPTVEAIEITTIAGEAQARQKQGAQAHRESSQQLDINRAIMTRTSPVTRCIGKTMTRRGIEKPIWREVMVWLSF